MKVRNIFSVVLTQISTISLLGFAPSATNFAATVRAALPAFCHDTAPLCTEQIDRTNYEANYIGRDEPSLLHYSNTPGSGNSNVHRLSLPTGPRALPKQAGTPYAPGLAGQTVCVADLFCSPVVAQLGNPPASAAWHGITQATLSYPGYNFGPIFLAHVGTPEGWAFYDVNLGDRISVQWAGGGMSDYSVVSIRRYKLVDDSHMQDVSTGSTLTNMQIYALNQSAPYLSLETCIPSPDPMQGTGGRQALDVSNWGRMFIQAEPLSEPEPVPTS